MIDPNTRRRAAGASAAGLADRRAEQARQQPRLRRLLQSAVRCGGSMAAMADDLGVTPRVFLQRLSLLRSRGVAQTLDLIDPRRLGRPFRTITLVRLARPCAADIRSFETAVAADPAITAAQWVSGGHDYRLSTYHADRRAASLWLKALCERAEVSDARQIEVRPLFGHELPGLMLHGGGDLAGACGGADA
jgi:hypothetical protein